MKVGFICLIALGTLATAAGAQEVFKYDFNDFNDGPIDGQQEWNVYDKVKDSSALSIVDELGTSEAKGDKALVVRADAKEIRCVTGDPIRWLPGHTLSVEFDFKLATEPATLAMNKPTLTLLVGDGLLSEKARFSVGIEALPNGDWMLTGAMPDPAEKKIYSENFLFRSDGEVAVSKWHQLKLVVKKLSEPDTYESKVEIRNALSGEVVAELAFTSNDKGKVAQGVWNSTRAHVGFHARNTLLGLVCVDNLTITSFK